MSKRTWVLPVAETDTIVVGAASEVKNDTQNDEAGDCDNLDRTSKWISNLRKKKRLVEHGREDKFGLSIGPGAEHVDGDDDDDTYCHPDCVVNVWVPEIYQEGSSG